MKRLIFGTYLFTAVLALMACGEATTATSTNSDGSASTLDTAITYDTLITSDTVVTGGDTVITSDTLVSADTTVTTSTVDEASGIFTNRDLEQTADTVGAQYITLVSGQDVTITAAGVYVIRGTETNVTILVNADTSAKVQIVLDGVSVTNTDAPVIYVKAADKVFVTSTDSENYMKVSGTYVADGETNLDAVIFSKEDLVLNGVGSLEIISTKGNGVVSKDELKVTGGTYTITAANHGLQANDAVSIADGNLTIVAGTDGIHSEYDEDDSVGSIYIAGGTINIKASDDGIHATSILHILAGTIVVNAVEGLEATYILIDGGTITVTASDDGINASDKSSAYDVLIEVNGGTISVTVSGGDVDGFDANGDIEINGGTINVTCPTQAPSGAFDADGTATLNGGTVKVNGTVVTKLTSSMGGRGG